MKHQKKGFTLIEMLVVIAVIGILSAAILTALVPARNKAKDTRIVSGLQQVRSIAETLYANGSYSALPTGAIANDNSNFGTTATDIAAQNGALHINVTTGETAGPAGQGYRAWSKLNSGNYYCVNSAGFAGEVSSALGDTLGTDPACK